MKKNKTKFNLKPEFKKNVKIQILISKTSWAVNYKKEILNKLKKFSSDIKIFHDHKKLKNNYDINIIFSYFKILPQKYTPQQESRRW